MPFCIKKLEQANIKLIILTGDSLENSITTAYKSGLFNKKFTLTTINST